MLAAEGLANTDIAVRLVLSRKTVEHHVSSVLRKVGAGSRRDLREVVAKLGLARQT